MFNALVIAADTGPVANACARMSVKRDRVRDKGEGAGNALIVKYIS